MTNRMMMCDDINAIDMVAYLSGRGHEPVKIIRNDYWYCSPLRGEHEASFKVNRKMNAWYDFGIGKGGGMVDFCLLYYNCSVTELLKKFDDSFFVGYQVVERNRYEEKVSAVEILETSNLGALPLISYLKERHIPSSIANEFCKEVRYRINDKTFYAIGFKNDKGGYELRNKFTKISTSPKAITTLNNGYDNLHVFEGFFDFLSFVAWNKGKVFDHGDHLILNSAAFFEKSLDVMDRYKKVNLFLDNDVTGKKYTQLAQARSERFINRSPLYESHKDLNDWYSAKMLSIKSAKGRKYKL